MKITVIGAGNVGATSAMRLLEAGLGDVVLLDIAEGIAKGKAEDLMDAASLMGHGKNIIGTSDYSDTKDSDIVVITAGFARKPGMTREELLQKNTSVMRSVAKGFKEFNNDPIVIVVTNPLDIMTFLIFKESMIDSKRVLGMAGCLDSSRMNLMAERVLNKPLQDMDSLVLGTHGETMAPILSHSKINSVSFSEAIKPDEAAQIIEKTKLRGAEIVSYLGTGSAFYAPSAGVFRMVKAVVHDTQEILPCSCFLNGEYGFNDMYLGVPAQIGKDGVEDIIELPLNDDEKQLLERAADSTRKQIAALKI
ncbi:MAG: malate dehydrogenase [Candidatus Orphnella occulta]|nr:malate dehydrogenase [Candidatus Orphnella occulta]